MDIFCSNVCKSFYKSKSSTIFVCPKDFGTFKHRRGKLHFYHSHVHRLIYVRLQLNHYFTGNLNFKATRLSSVIKIVNLIAWQFPENSDTNSLFSAIASSNYAYFPVKQILRRYVLITVYKITILRMFESFEESLEGSCTISTRELHFRVRASDFEYLLSDFLPHIVSYRIYPFDSDFRASYRILFFAWRYCISRRYVEKG